MISEFHEAPRGILLGRYNDANEWLRHGNVPTLAKGNYKMRSVILAAAVACFGMSAGAHATQFITDGDFTDTTGTLGQIDVDTTVAGWTANGGYSFVFNKADTGSPAGVALWDKADGGTSTWDGMTKSGSGNFIAMDGDYITEPVSQTVTGLTVGKTYDLSFNYAFGQQSGFSGDTEQHITASFGSWSAVVPTPDEALPSLGFSGWSTYTTSLTATDTSETLSFLAYGNLPVPPFALVSDVSLTGTVPEPSTWALMLLGFGGLGYAGFRSRRRTIAAA